MRRRSARLLLPRWLTLACCACAVVCPAQLVAQPSNAPPAAASRGYLQLPVDPRVQIKSYLFADTSERIPYAVFVSSKVRPEKKSPLIVALHGLGGTHTSLLRGNAVELAEQGGYILVGPMGYDPRGWYGVPAAPRPDGARRTGDGIDPPNVRELSEKDVRNVLDIMRKEFNVDERRIYLMGHSMGGAGALYLAVKYPGDWAAIAAIAPAAFGLDPESIARIPAMPVMIVHGDRDTAVPVSLSRSWVEVLEKHGMTHEYLEVAGGDHGSVIPTGMPAIFAFFDAHAKPELPTSHR